MKQILRSGFLLIAACATSGLGLQAQTVLYATDFPDDQGWTLTSSFPPVVWAVDGTPIGGLSAPFSLNFNNGSNLIPYGDGTATSPPIDLSAATGDTYLNFWCYYATEGGPACGFDLRGVHILDSLNQTVFFQCWWWVECGSMGQWHFHSIPLQEQWGTIRVEFIFDTVDSQWNGGAGWFIDDLEVTTDCLVDAPYCTPKLNSQGCSPLIFTTGAPSLGGTGTAFRIWADNVLNQKVGLMLWSRSPASTFFGGGTLCVAAPITRAAAQNSGGTSLPAQDCTGTYVLQFSPEMMNQAGLVVGDDVYSQYWSRDNGFPPPNNVGLTGGVHWSVCP